MKLGFLPCATLLGIFLLFPIPHALAPAAENADAEPATEPPPDASSFNQLPAPLNGISGNVTDLEESGHFKIVKAEIGRTKLFQDEALIWTVDVIRPVACRHVQILFRRVADVRFYRIEHEGKWRKQLLATQLFYPQWIDSGAVNRESLNRDEQFQIWIQLSAAEVDMLQHQRASTIIFSHPDRRTILETKEQKHKFPMPSVIN